MDDKFGKIMGRLVVGALAIVFVAAILALGFRLVRWIAGF